MSFVSYNETKGTKGAEHIRVNRNKGRVNGRIFVFKYIDKDTEQHVMFIPSLDITSYGSTPERATEMLQESINSYFQYLMDLSPEKTYSELRSMGWTKGIFNKEFSRAFVDEDGRLKNLNAVEDKVERLTLTTA